MLVLVSSDFAPHGV